VKLIVGLGNPELKAGEKYVGTRHNLGFEVLEEMRKKLNLGEWPVEKKFKAEILQTNSADLAKQAAHTGNIQEGEQILLVRPQTYMNKSGMAVAAVARFYKVKPEDIIVIHDDLDLLIGKMKVRLGGGAAGHHGVESIINDLGSDKFIRVRLGIGNTLGFLGEHKRSSFSAEHFVLETFEQKEKSKVKSMVKHAIQALEAVLEKGIEKAQNQYN
jgi:peptidyl-tRNA hydrolase, PTH1 family